MPAAAVPVIWQFANVATPATAATVVAVQAREPVAGPLAIARVTFPVSVVTVLPKASCTVTTGGVVNATPSVTPPTGWVVKASLFAAPTVMTTLFEAPVEVSPLRVAASV